MGQVRLKFLSKEDLMKSNRTEKKDITDLIAKVNVKEATFIPLKTNRGRSSGDMGAPRVVNYEINNATSVHLNETGKNRLISFFEKLAQLANSKKKVHILHFGDSQIEGDRMTGFIRQRMQEQFGGYGPGLIPANNVYSTTAFRQTFSDNFIRYTCFGGAKLSNRKYGVMNSAARFTPEYLDTAKNLEQEAWIELGPNGAAHSRAKSYNQVKMFYNSCTVPCRLKVLQGGKVIHEEFLKTDGAAHTVNLGFSGTPGNLRFEFKSLKSPNIVGFSMEGDYGVQVDNIAMRGSSGTFFGSIDKSSFSQMMKELHVDMVIMQFGGNSMPSLKDSASVRSYAKYVQSQLEVLKKLNPELAVIFIGPSDMSKLLDGEYRTYPLLPYCVEQLKKIAVHSGVGYWDLYEAMGGKNSMPAWVEKDLGRSDHVHFSIKGSTIAAQLFYDAFIAEYLKLRTE